MIIFTLNMIPKPQKQTQFTFKGRKPHAWDPSKKQLHFIQWQIRPYAPKEPFDGPIFVDYTFYLPIPKATVGIKKKQMINNIRKHIKPPDASNIHYIFENAMKGIVYKDDCQITDYSVHKQYGETPKVVIKVLDLNSINHYEIPENKYLKDS